MGGGELASLGIPIWTQAIKAGAGFPASTVGLGLGLCPHREGGGKLLGVGRLRAAT